MAIRLLNQVGGLVGERLEDLPDLMRVIKENHLTMEQILSAYTVSREELEFWAGDLEKMIEIANDHLREQAARRSLDAGVILELDHTVPVTAYRGAYGINLARIFGRGTENDEAWRTAFMTPLEAYAKMINSDDGWFNYETVKRFVYWCRQSVGLPPDLVFREEGGDEATLVKK
ncbi:MAG: hypothetical protein AAB660_02335 [Patescibacteria group bacterium]